MSIRERLSGNEAVANAMRQINPDVVAAFPITPSTEVPQYFSTFVNNGVVGTEFVPVESEHSAMSACIGASAAGGRVMTATSANGLSLMWEMLYIASSLRLPIVMACVNRAVSGPLNIHNLLIKITHRRISGMKKIILILCVCVAIALLGYKILVQKQEKVEITEVPKLDGKIVLYFKGNEAMKLEKEYRNVSMKRIAENMAKTVVEELLKGPTNEELHSLIPVDTKLLNIESQENTVILDLSNEFIEKQEGESNALLAIYSIVNSLTEITEIEQVKFLINGKEMERFKDYFEFDKPFVRSIE